MFDFEFHEYQEMIVDLLQGTKLDIFFLISHKKWFIFILTFQKYTNLAKKLI